MSKRSRQDSNPALGQKTTLSDSQSLSGADGDASSQTPYKPGKYAHLDDSVESAKQSYVIHCTLPPHDPLGFSSYEDYETHYQKTHVNRCIECNRNFPTEHFLNLHIAENHDPLNAAKRDRGDKTYQCFVEGCDKVCRTWQKRRMHLVDAHMFPRNYDFYIVNDGLDHRNSMLRPKSSCRRQSSASSSPSQSSTGGGGSLREPVSERISQKPARNGAGHANHKADAEMSDIADSLAALTFVPKSVTFGRRKGAGLAKS